MPCGDTSPVCGDVSGGKEGLHTGGPGAREILIVRCSAGHKGNSRQVWGPGETAVSEESPIPQPFQHTGMPVPAPSPLLAMPRQGCRHPAAPGTAQLTGTLLTPQTQGHGVQEAAVLAVAAVCAPEGRAGARQHQGSLLDHRALRQRRGARSPPSHC